ncbi:MAG: ABC transporter ATP-binding protein [Candidatus Neomarinimicrobiota bacterium]
MNSSILIVQALSKSYGPSVVALNGLNLDVSRGVIFGFVGPNGAGKTTTINILANILKRDSGEIHLFGESLTEKSYKYKGRTGFVLERPTYIEKLSAKEYLTFAGAMYGLEEKSVKERTSELIGFFELKDKQDKWIETYSAGMKKKVSLSAALIHDPEFLVLDEPFEGMDAIAVKKTKKLFLDLKKKGTTILITSHILSYVENLCDEVAIIHKGRVVYQNTIEDIRSEFREKLAEDPKLSALEEIFLSVVEEKEKQAKNLSWVENNK